MPRRRHELDDEQWQAVRGLLPRRATADPDVADAENRLFLNAVLFVAKTGVPWRDLPERFGLWNSVWRRFDRWSKAGRWKAIAHALNEPDLEEVQLDSTSIRAHRSACGSLRRPGEKKNRPTSDAPSAVPAGA